MGKKSTRRRRRSRKRRSTRRNNQRGGGCIKNNYTSTDPTPAGVAFEPGKNNGLGGGYYYKQNQNPSLLGFPHSTVGKMGVSKKGGRRRRRRRRRRRKKKRRTRRRGYSRGRKHSKKRRRSRKKIRHNQRGGHVPSYRRGELPSLSGLLTNLLPADVVDVGRDIGTGAKNYLHKYQGELPAVGGNVMNQPDLQVINKPTHIF